MRSHTSYTGQIFRQTEKKVSSESLPEFYPNIARVFPELDTLAFFLFCEGEGGGAQCPLPPPPPPSHTPM